MAQGLDSLTPGQVVVGRLLAGAATLAAAVAVSRRPLPRDPALYGHLAVVGVLLCVLPFSLFAWAQQYLPSGLASIYNATTLLMTAAVALAALPAERLTRARAAGLATGFAGVLVVLGPWTTTGGRGPGAPDLACLLATASYGLAFVYLRRFVAPRAVPAVQVAAIQVGLAALVALALSPVLAAGPVTTDLRALGAVAALGALGAGLAYVWNTGVVSAWGATAASTVTYLTPVVGVTLGVALRGERLAWHQPVGAVVVVLGIALSQGVLSRGVPGRVTFAPERARRAGARVRR